MSFLLAAATTGGLVYLFPGLHWGWLVGVMVFTWILWSTEIEGEK